MGWIRKMIEQRQHLSTLRDPARWLTDWFGGAESATGVRVTPDTARRIAAVWCAVRIISESVASLPLFVYRRLPRGRVRLTDTPLHRILHEQPNPWQTSFEFREMMQGHLCLRGNAYAEILYDERGAVRALVPLHPDYVQVYDVTDQGINGQSVVYVYRPRQGTERYILAGEMLHLRGPSDNKLTGISLVGEFAETFGLSIGTERYAAKFFGNYANPGGILTHPKALSEKAKERLRHEVQNRYSGLENAHRTMILEEGMTWTQIGIKPQDSQLLESRKFSITEFARLFRIPPHMLADLDRATFSNIEQQSIEFVVHCLRPWLVRWEQRLAVSLLSARERDAGWYIEFNVDGLLRGDVQSRYQAYAIGRQWGWLSANEIREKENLNPRDDPGGDAYLEPLNMQSSAREEITNDDNDDRATAVALNR